MIYIIMGAMMLISFQNCGSGFNAITQGRTPASLFSSDSSEAVNVEDAPAAFFQTKSKTIGSAKATKVIAWNLASEASSGYSTTSVQAQISITTISPPDGSPDTYYISKVAVTASSKPIRVQGINIWINGSKYEEGTTFKGINQAVGAGQTVTLSMATMLYQAVNGSQATDTVAISFDTLWPDDEPLPNSGSGTTSSGLALYNANCASCHSALASSQKKGKSFMEIRNAIYTTPSMALLQGKLTDPQIQAIASELAK